MIASLPRPRDAQLDGLRGLAALMVVFAHLVLALHPALLGGGERVAHFPHAAELGHTGLIFLYNPDLAVTVFFVLSGYVLAGSATAGAAPFSELVVRRYVRLALPILAASAFAWALVEAGAFHPQPAADLAKSTWLAEPYAWAATQGGDALRMLWLALAGCFAFGPYDYDPALWTMPTEFWGSCLLFAAYRALPGTFASREGGLVVAAFAILLGWNTSFAGFGAGVALFEIMRRLPARRDWAAPLGGALCLAGVVLGGTPYLIDLPAGGTYARIFLALASHVENPVGLLHRTAAVCLVAAALLWRPLQAGLHTAPVQFLGRVSFMLYLLHVPVICALADLLLPRWTEALGYNPASAAVAGLAIAISLALAEAGTRCVDHPAITLARRAGAATPGLLRSLLSLARGPTPALSPTPPRSAPAPPPAPAPPAPHRCRG